MVAATLLWVASIMSGCGGGGSAPAEISGKVIDGYLVNATVFLDKNGNYHLDEGEPSAITDQNGDYTLRVDPSDVGKYPIVVLAIKGQTLDNDTGLALQNSYVLSLPATAVNETVGSNFVTPMSTHVRELLETGKYSSMQQAEDHLRTQLGLPQGTDVMGDYVLSQNSLMHTAAQNVAKLMGRQASWLFSSSTANIDVNRYRAMIGTIFGNLPTVKHATTHELSALTSTISSNLTGIQPGLAFRNMSASFRPAPAQVFIDFEASTAKANFEETSQGNSSVTTYGGRGNSGGISTDWYTRLNYKGRSFDFSQINRSITVSSFYKIANYAPIGYQMGLTFGEVYLVPASSELDYVNKAFVNFGSINQAGSLKDQIFGGSLAAPGSFPGFSHDYPPGMFKPGFWYELKVTFTNLGQNIGYHIIVNEYDAGGFNFIQNIVDLNMTTIDSFGLTNDTTVFAGFAFSNVKVVDDFSISVTTAVP